MKFKIYQETRIGGRHTNQDRIGYLFNKDSILLAVCDGMGGHSAGDVAAQFVIDYIGKFFKQFPLFAIEDPSGFLKLMLLKASDELKNFASKQQFESSPRTTCVVALIQDDTVWTAHTGDSRFYLFRNAEIRKKTVDHSIVQKWINSGVITEDEALVHPERNKIYSCLGQEVVPTIDVSVGGRISPGDVILMCTDGLWGALRDDRLLEVSTRYHPEISLPMLLNSAEAITGGDSDNLSAISLEWIGENNEKNMNLNKKEFIEDKDISISVDMILSAINRK